MGSMAKQVKKLTRTLRNFVQYELNLNTRAYAYTKNTPDELHLICLDDNSEMIVKKADYPNFNW